MAASMSHGPHHGSHYGIGLTVPTPQTKLCDGSIAVLSTTLPGTRVSPTHVGGELTGVMSISSEEVGGNPSFAFVHVQSDSITRGSWENSSLPVCCRPRYLLEGPAGDHVLDRWVFPHLGSRAFVLSQACACHPFST